jgi:chromate transport protein ChrA
LGPLVRLVLRPGFAGIGGPLVQIAIMETEVVERRRWLSKREFRVGLASVGILWRFKVDTVWLVLGAGAVGWLWSLVR